MRALADRYNFHRVFRFFLPLVAVVALLSLSSMQLSRWLRFGDMYDCYIIVDAEVSPYSSYRTPERSDLISEIVEVEEDYEQVDYEELMSILARGRYVHAGFLPAWRLQLYDDDGVRYRIYVSKSCRFFRIDGNYFKLSYRQAQRLRALFGQS